MRIVFLNPIGALGGAERCLLNMLAALQQVGGCDLHLILASPGPLAELARDLNVQVTMLPMPDAISSLGDSALKSRPGLAAMVAGTARSAAVAWAARRYAGQLSDQIRRLKPDIVHSNGIKCHLLTCMAKLRGMPVIWHLHDYLQSRPLMSRSLRWASRAATAGIAVSESVSRDAQKVLPGLRIHTVTNTIDIRHFCPGPSQGDDLDRLAGLPAAEPRVLRVGMVATYARWKGHHVFLEAAAQLLRERPHAAIRFYIVGGPIYRTRGSQFSSAELRASIDHLGLAEQVGLIDFQPDPAPIYRALDVVVHASTQPEPFGLTIAEAMACGKAVVVSACGGAQELFAHERDALGYPAGDAAALAAAIKWLTDDADLRRRLGTAARNTALEKFPRDSLGAQLHAIYGSCRKD